MKALVVGGAGYLGSVVTRLMVREGHHVVVLDECSTGHADVVPAGVEFVRSDITEAGTVLAGGSFGAVLHFAAPVPMSIGPRRPGDPAWLVASNALAGQRLGWTPRLSLGDMIADAWAFQTNGETIR